MPDKEDLLNWLNDAYSMEQTVIKTLKGYKKSAEPMPGVAQKIGEHIEVSKRQAERVKECIESLGGDVSKLKEAGAVAVGFVQGMANRPAGDTAVKNALAGYATEYFEMASYRVLTEAARQLGEEAVARVCEEIIIEEQQMADWIEGHWRELVRNFKKVEAA